jgi:hypothetical protein
MPLACTYRIGSTKKIKNFRIWYQCLGPMVKINSRPGGFLLWMSTTRWAWLRCEGGNLLQIRKRLPALRDGQGVPRQVVFGGKVAGEIKKGSIPEDGALELTTYLFGLRNGPESDHRLVTG